MKTRLLWGILLVALAASFGGYLLSPAKVEPPPNLSGLTELPLHGEVPDEELIEASGQPFKLSSLRGRPWIADFIFTSCAGICPQMTARMAQMQKELPAGVHLVSISVDPQRDAPDVLAAYAQRYGADPARWHFLTGPMERIPDLVSRGFGLGYAEGVDPREPIIHSQRFVLVDAEGSIRGYYDSTDPERLRRLHEDATALLPDASK